VAPFRIFFVSDLHGSEVCFRKFLNSAPIYRPDLLVYGGDIMGKLLQPVFRQDDGRFRWYPAGGRVEEFSADQLPQVERRIADQGRYSLVTTPPEWQRRQADREGLEKFCREIGKERVRGWLRLVEERLLPKKIPIVMNVGNDDTDGVLEILRHEAPTNLLVPEGQVVRCGPYEIYGCGYANMTPWHCPRDLEEPDLGQFLQRTSTEIDTPGRTILDIHAPPVNTSLDLAPELAKLVDNQTIRILDLVVLTKDTFGDVTVAEFDELDQFASFTEIDAEVGGLISAEDIDFVGDDLDPGSAAAVLLVEDLWAASLADALDRSGGFMNDGARIPRDLVDAAVAEL